jgi:hypothetical protein
MGKCHFSRPLTVSLADAYRYYSDIELYTTRYGRYYGTIEVLDRTPNTLTARMFVHISLSKDIQHENVEVRYTFIPQKEIRYQIVQGDKLNIENATILRSLEDVGDKQPYKSAVEMNNVPLDIMCYPPHSMSLSDEKYSEYQRMIMYFVEQDIVHLEKKNWEGWKIGQVCPKCNKGHLQRRGKKEETRTTSTDFFHCDYCGWQFRGYRLDT